jgi:SpoIID/LytB domain protein
VDIRPTTAPRRHVNRLPAAWLTAAIAAVLLVGLAPVASTTAASQSMVPACDGINIRTATSTHSTVTVRLGINNTLTVTGTVSGAAWGTRCPTWKSGSGWYTVSHINGVAVSARYGVSVLYAATGILTAPVTSVPSTAPSTVPSAAPATAPSTVPPAQPAGIALMPACNGVNVRTSTSTRSTVKVRLGINSRLTASGTVTGAAWGTTCPTWKSGSGWYRITAINGRSVSSLYGVTALYAATGILKADAGSAPPPSSTAPPTPSPAPTAAPTAPPPATAAPAPGDLALVPACDGINIRASASTRSTIKARLSINTTLTVSGTVSGAAWGTTCPTWKSGSSWYKVSAINGTSVATLYGVSALYAATGILTAPVTLNTSGLTALDESVTFYGRGYGHGVGLSQYGARGRALAGQSAAEILAHYYAGTTIGTIATDTQIRVLVLDDFAPTPPKPLTIFGRGGTSSVSGLDLQLPADGRLRLYPPTTGTTTWRLVIDAVGGGILYDGVAPTDFRIASTSGESAIQVYSKPSVYDLYRGSLRVLATGSTVDVVNELPLESYLRGVVPAEMPSSWPLEARIAQTIAARSYAAYHIHPTTGTFDVYDSTRSQVYGGAKRERAAADAAIASTPGQVLRSGKAVVDALFHSTAGGATENNENVFVSSSGSKVAPPVSYLRGSSDRDPAGVPYDAAAPYAAWQTKAYSLADLSAILVRDSRTNVGTLSGLDLRNRGVSGRLISVTLVGSSGTRVVSGDAFVAAFNAGRPPADAPLRSTLFGIAAIP